MTKANHRAIGLLRGFAVFGLLGLVLAFAWFKGYSEPSNGATTVGRSFDPKPRKAAIKEAPACGSWRFDWPPRHPASSKLTEMSGLATSRLFADILYHVMDSGNDPIIYVTDFQGQILKEVPYQKDAWDVEALSRGPCPWGGSCLYAADTGDNFHFRIVKRIDALDERSLFQSSLRTVTVEFTLPEKLVLDIEAVAVHPVTGDLFLMSKERRISRVFKLPVAVWQNTSRLHVAEYVGEIGHAMISDATWSQDGLRLLLISSMGILERSDTPGFQTERVTGWYPHERKLHVPVLDQQEAAAYLPDERSVIYTSEKKPLRSTRWGIVSTQCDGGARL